MDPPYGRARRIVQILIQRDTGIQIFPSFMKNDVLNVLIFGATGGCGSQALLYLHIIFHF
jgi:hypothetical protein